MYHVTRQNGFYDEELRIEIAIDRDEISPGMLVPNYDEEGEYNTAAEAVDAALELAKHYPEETRPEITISAGASIGLYPTSDDGRTEEELQAWVEKRSAMEDEEMADDDPDWETVMDEVAAQDENFG